MAAFNPELIQIVDTEIIENGIWQVAELASIDPSTLSHACRYIFDVKMDISKRYVRVFFTIEIHSIAPEMPDNVIPTLISIAFSFNVANLDALASEQPDGANTSDLQLLCYLCRLVYDRACGVISGLSQKTYLHHLMLPILSTEELSSIITAINGQRDAEPFTAN